MAEAMRFHVHTLNQMERRQEQMRILDKEIAKGLSQKTILTLVLECTYTQCTLKLLFTSDKKE